MLKKTLFVVVLAILTLGVSAFSAGLPEGWTRYDDVILPAQMDNLSRALIIRPLLGQAKGIAILYQWSNRKADTLSHRQEDYEEILFSTGTYPTGSLNDYFLENSFGKFSIAGAVTRWYMAPDNYNINNQYNWIDQAVALADPEVDFSQFDSDGDGIVDIVYLVHAGPAGEETGNPNDPWSWAWIGGAGVPTDDGVIVDAYTLQPEEHADSSILAIAVTRHESGHILAQFPDLYDYDHKLDTTTYYTPNDWNDHPVQDWCAMGYGGYGIFSYRYGPGPSEHPTHYCGLFKNKVGWIEPIILDHSQPGVTIYSTEQHDSASLYKIVINGSTSEYFLIENRYSGHPGLFDHLDSDYSAFFSYFTPGSNPLDAGLIITHVDEDMPQWSFNDGTPSYDHYGAVIEDAGYNPSTPWNESEFTEFWYPYECQVGAAFSREDMQASFTPYTKPSTNGYTGPSGVWITNISHSGDIMTFDFYLESDPPVFAEVFRWPDTIFTGPFPVYAIILDTFGIISDSLYYAINDGAFTPVTRDSIHGDSLYWYHIPYIAIYGDSINYYMAATDNAQPPNRGVSGDYKFHVWPYGLQEQNIEIKTPAIFTLSQNNPNPFQRSTYINYQLQTSSFITLKVYNIIGELVTTLVNEFQNPGNHQVCWDGKDAKGRRLASGVYLYCLAASRQSKTRQMVIVK